MCLNKIISMTDTVVADSKQVVPYVVNGKQVLLLQSHHSFEKYPDII